MAKRIKFYFKLRGNQLYRIIFALLLIIYYNRAGITFNLIDLKMNPKSLLLKLTCFLSILFILQSCGSDKPGTYKNDEIRSANREDFHALNDKLFVGLTANNAKLLEGIMSQEFIADNAKLRLVELMSNQIKLSPYTLLDEYYAINDKRGKHVINEKNEGVNNHTITYDAVVPEMYLAFFVPKCGQDKYMISAQYCKLDYGWKLTGLELSPYTQNGQTAPELFKQAKADYAKNYLVNAVDFGTEANACLNPFSGWEYPIQADMGEFEKKAFTEASKKYKFPIILKQVTGQPRIFRISHEKKPDGTFPMIYYLTTVKLADTNAIKQENMKIQKVIGQVIPGIDKEKKYLLFAAFNELPRFDISVDRYEITDRLR